MEVIYDDRSVSAGNKFSDADLLGVPVRVVVSPRNLKESVVEVSTRDKSLMEKVPVENAEQYVKDLVEKMKKSVSGKINGKNKRNPVIPFGLLGGFCDHLEIRITGLSEEGFSFRVPEKNRKSGVP